MSVRLERMTAATAAALLDGKRPSDVAVAEDYPTEFSRGVAAQVANGSDLGPYVIRMPTSVRAPLSRPRGPSRVSSEEALPGTL